LSADIDHPTKSRPNAHHLLLPTNPFNTHFHERFTTRQIYRRFQEKTVHQFRAPFADFGNTSKKMIENPF